MYELAVLRDFIASHYLCGQDLGAENSPHNHHYKMQVRLEGSSLDAQGFLVDINQLDSCLDNIVHDFKDCLINDRPEMKGLNPSLENLSRVVCLRIAQEMKNKNVCSVTVSLWEDEKAWASFRCALFTQSAVLLPP